VTGNQNDDDVIDLSGDDHLLQPEDGGAVGVEVSDAPQGINDVEDDDADDDDADEEGN
jgi:hypothetical protein